MKSKSSALLAALAACLAPASSAERISGGVLGGIRFTQDVTGSYGNQAEQRIYTIGPAVEIALSPTFSVQLGMLYKRTGYVTRSPAFGVNNDTRVRANWWEFPVLVKRSLPVRFLNSEPFAGGGYVLGHASGVEGVVRTYGTQPDGTPVDATMHFSRLYGRDPIHGIAVCGGLRFAAARVRVSPELRYTRWTARALDEQGSRGFSLQSSRNEVQLLLGVTF